MAGEVVLKLRNDGDARDAHLDRETRGGKDYDSSWSKRMTGGGPVAWMIGRRFELACAKLGFNRTRTKLTTDHFNPPGRAPAQLTLF